MIESKGLSASLHCLPSLLASHASTRPLADRAQSLHARLSSGRFHLAVLGQFKRGKSTLLNALLGEPFLPTGVVPVTAIPTLIEYGPARQARIIFREGAPRTVGLDELAAYVTEAANPHNELGVARVEVQHPAPLLAQGVVLIDTPGIGSTLTHNTETALNFLAEVDAAFFLVSADPPLTAVELDFLGAVQQRVARLFFLLNKVDYLTPGEQHEALHFLETTLRQQGGLDGDLRLFPISARLALEAQARRDAAGWMDSGMAAVEAVLNHFLRTEKQEALQAAITAKTRGVVFEALQLLQIEQRALTMPLDELQQKRRVFQEALVMAQQRQQQAADLLQGDRKRIVETINRRALALRQEAEAQFRAVVEAAVASDDLDEAERSAQQCLGDAAELFFQERYGPFSEKVQAEVAALLAAYAYQADALVDDLRRLAADLFAFNFVPLNPDEPPTRLRVPYWARSALASGLGLPISPGLWERLLPLAKRRQRILNRMQPLAERLAARNTENLRWAVVQNSEQVMRQFQARLDERWAETIEATAAVLDTAVTRREQHTQEIAGSLHELEQVIRELEALAQELPGA